MLNPATTVPASGTTKTVTGSCPGRQCDDGAVGGGWGVLVIGQQSGDGADGVVKDVAAAKEAGQAAPVLHMGDGVLNKSASGSVWFPLRFTEFRDAGHPFEPLLLMFQYGREDLPEGLSAESLVAGHR